MLRNFGIGHGPGLQAFTRIPLILSAVLVATSGAFAADTPQLSLSSPTAIDHSVRAVSTSRLIQASEVDIPVTLLSDSVLLLDAGPPDYANGLNIVSYGIAQSFLMPAEAVIENVLLPVTVGPDVFNGKVSISVYADNAGEVGALIATTTATVLSSTPASGTITGFGVTNLDCRLDRPMPLLAGSYWLRPQLNDACASGSAIYWATATNGAASAIRYSASNQCAGPFATPYQAEASFTLYGYLGPFDPCRFGSPAPVITNCPEDFTVSCNTQGGYIQDFVPTVTSDCDTVTYTISPDGVLPYGTTYVTVTVEDSGGNSSTCSYNVTVVPDQEDLFRRWSIPSEDGGVRAPTTDVSAPGPVFSTGTRAEVGDDSRNLQNVLVLSFDTSDLPDDANITATSIRLVRASASGNPNVIGDLILDMGNPLIGGSEELTASDYDFGSAAAHDVASSFPFPAGDGFTTLATVKPEFNDWVNREGRTQFVVRFSDQSDFDFVRDSISFHTGESAIPTRPELIVAYNIDRCFAFPTPPKPCEGDHEVIIYSNAYIDGAVGESHFTSEVGGQTSTAAGTAAVGDAAYGAQQMIFLQFDTSVIPPEATIDLAELRLLRTSAIGAPGETLGRLVVDMRNPYLTLDTWYFGSSPLTQGPDFEAFAHFPIVAVVPIPAVDGPTTTLLDAKGRQSIYKGVGTQMRVRFEIGDDGDSQADQVTFALGDYGPGSPWRPRLRVVYRIPCGDAQPLSTVTQAVDSK